MKSLLCVLFSLSMVSSAFACEYHSNHPKGDHAKSHPVKHHTHTKVIK